MSGIGGGTSLAIQWICTSNARAWIWSLVREIKSHLPHRGTKKKKLSAGINSFIYSFIYLSIHSFIPGTGSIVCLKGSQTHLPVGGRHVMWMSQIHSLRTFFPEGHSPLGVSFIFRTALLKGAAGSQICPSFYAGILAWWGQAFQLSKESKTSESFCEISCLDS